MKFFAKTLKQVSNVLFRFSEKIHKEKYRGNIAFEEWAKVTDPEALRLNYKLDGNSIVFDLGGYKGEWSKDIYCKYGSKILIFEPVPSFAAKIKYYFSGNDKVEVFCFGLSDQDALMSVGLCDNETSGFKSGKENIDVQLKDVMGFLKKKNITHIDLMKINIEGGEYDLLEKLIQSGFVKNINNLQIQFHNFIPDAANRMKQIREKLSNSHFATYQYDFIWENWKIKNK